MRRICIPLILFLCGNCAPVAAQQVADSLEAEISPRIGMELDRIERDYFGLFPSISGFVSAKASARTDGGMRMDIYRKDSAGAGDTIIILNQLLRESLRQYVEGYEAMNRILGSSYELIDLPPLFGLLAKKGIVGMHPLPMREPVEITIRRSDGKRFQGILCYADSSCIVIAHPDSLFSWNNPHALLLTPVAAIAELTHPQKGKFGRDFGKAFLVGFIAGSTVVQSMGSSHNSGTDYPPAGLSAIMGVLCGLASGVVGSALLRGSMAQTTVSIGGAATTYLKYYPLLREQCLYRQVFPPEILLKVRRFAEHRP